MALRVKNRHVIQCLHKYFSTSLNANVDQQEINNFKKYSDEWWNEYGPTRGLHSLNKLRIPFIRDGLINESSVNTTDINTSTPLKGLYVLDVGCGGGILSECLSRLGANVTGIDANPDIIGLAQKHAEKNSLNINYCFGTIENHHQEKGVLYDAVVASEIIEHVSEKEEFIKSCANCLKPCGSLFVTTINKTFLANILAVCVAENLLQVVPKGTHQHEKFISPTKLQRLLEDNDIQTKLIHGMAYNVFTNWWYWTSDTSVNYALHGVKYK
ncbi:ubiquinone biosynthesis protein COQ3, mitochondrial [Rhynchophorus ferrugineus]|uniref:ubiquinone biosynthesis protein COQ3, mitochondrial n=1 Tax=Rhynchophorus ferrugineus TaxID=354439 RepID=UPI003FCC362C